jgi:hypothetical protein
MVLVNIQQDWQLLALDRNLTLLGFKFAGVSCLIVAG